MKNKKGYFRTIATELKIKDFGGYEKIQEMRKDYTILQLARMVGISQSSLANRFRTCQDGCYHPNQLEPVKTKKAREPEKEMEAKRKKKEKMEKETRAPQKVDTLIGCDPYVADKIRNYYSTL